MEDLPSAELQLSEGPALGQNTHDDDDDVVYGFPHW